jgi:hypothetical protein
VAALTGFAFSQGGGNYTGNFLAGVTAQQTGGSGAMCLTLNDTGSYSGPLTSNGRLDGRYCFEGTAATYSLT